MTSKALKWLVGWLMVIQVDEMHGMPSCVWPDASFGFYLHT